MSSKRRSRSERSRSRSRRSYSPVRKSIVKRSSKRSGNRSRSSSDDGDRGRFSRSSRSLSLTPEKSYKRRSRSPVDRRRTRSASSSPARSPRRARSVSRSKRSGGRYDRSRSGSRGRSRFARTPPRYARRPPRVSEPEPCKVLGVFNLSYNTTRRDLEREFGQFGKLTRADLVVDPRGDSRGFGFVSFERQRDADYARERMADTVFDGMKIRVDYSISRGPHPRTPGCYMGDNGQVRRDYYRHGSNYSRSPVRRGRRGGGRGDRSGSRESPSRFRPSPPPPTSSSRFSPIRWRD